MDRLRKRFVMLVVPVALILFASLVVAQGPPNSCANACWQAYTDAVRARRVLSVFNLSSGFCGTRNCNRRSDILGVAGL